MKDICKIISGACKVLFGYGIMICLFAGGLTFFGYLAALILGGDIAAAICVFIYKVFMPVVIRLSTLMVLLGLISMYLNGELALTPDKKKSSKHKGEM